jgi:hypothetical protein
MRRWSVALGLLAFASATVPVGLAPSGAEPTPIAPPTESAVQPGGQVLSSIGACTLNFLFKGSDGARYIGTAGHCIIDTGPTSFGDDKELESTWPVGSGPEASNSDEKRIGEWAYSVLGPVKDFSLIRLDPDVQAKPEMVHFGGPTGIYDELSEEPVTLHYYGQGVAFGDTVAGRSALALDTVSPDDVNAYGVAAPGDSGGGVITADGRAVGALVSIGINPFGPIRVTRLGPQLARAQELLGIKLTLETAPKA